MSMEESKQVAANSMAYWMNDLPGWVKAAFACVLCVIMLGFFAQVRTGDYIDRYITSKMDAAQTSVESQRQERSDVIEVLQRLLLDYQAKAAASEDGLKQALTALREQIEITKRIEHAVNQRLAAHANRLDRHEARIEQLEAKVQVIFEGHPKDWDTYVSRHPTAQ